MVPKSPYSGRVTAERPPGTSYSDIQPGVNWVDTLKMSSNSSSIGGNTMSRYNKDNKNRSGNDKSSRHVADENNNNYDNIPLKSILKQVDLIKTNNETIIVILLVLLLMKAKHVVVIV